MTVAVVWDTYLLTYGAMTMADGGSCVGHLLIGLGFDGKRVIGPVIGTLASWLMVPISRAAIGGRW